MEYEKKQMQDLLIDKYLLSFSTPILLQAAASSYVKKRWNE